MYKDNPDVMRMIGLKVNPSKTIVITVKPKIIEMQATTFRDFPRFRFTARLIPSPTKKPKLAINTPVAIITMLNGNGIEDK